MYSNYLLILNTLNTLLGYFFYSITASVGNLNVKEDAEKKYFIFRVINFANFWIYGFCTVCLWNLMDPFITLWLGENYVFDKYIVFAIILNFFTAGMQNAATTFRETTGLFKKGKYRPIIAAVINIIFSIILAKHIGIAGVFFGTIISRLCTYFWYDPYIIYNLVFKKSVKLYFARYGLFILLVLVAVIITDILGNIFNNSMVINMVIRSVLCLVIPNVIFLLAFRKTREFEYLIDIFKTFTIKIISRRLAHKNSSKTYL